MKGWVARKVLHVHNNKCSEVIFFYQYIFLSRPEINGRLILSDVIELQSK